MDRVLGPAKPVPLRGGWGLACDTILVVGLRPDGLPPRGYASAARGFVLSGEMAW